MAVRSHQRVGIGNRSALKLGLKDHLSQILQIDLMHYAGGWRNNAEITEGRLSPAQKGVPFPIPFILSLHVELKGVGLTKEIHLNRMIDDQVHRDQRINSVRVFSHLGHGITHHGQIHQGRKPGKVLKENSRRCESDFPIGLLFGVPMDHGLDIFTSHRFSILEAKQVFQHDFQREG